MFFPTVDQLAAAIGCARASALQWHPFLRESCAAYDITGSTRVPAYLAQVGHESQGLSRTVENLNYSALRLVQVWPSRFTPAQARDYAGQAQRIANHVYGGRLGNGPEGASNDGWDYRGRGLIQCTGKANYEAVTDLLRQHRTEVPDFVVKPDQLAEQKWAAFSAAAIWNDRGCNTLADARDFRGITKKINGGLVGLDDRLDRFARAQRALA